MGLADLLTQLGEPGDSALRDRRPCGDRTVEEEAPPGESLEGECANGWSFGKGVV
jgi:hypothetical protein